MTHESCDILCAVRKVFPNGNGLPLIIRKFGGRGNIPNVMAAVDGSHTPIKVPLSPLQQKHTSIAECRSTRPTVFCCFWEGPWKCP